MKQRKLTPEQSEEIRRLSETMSNIEIARRYNVSPQLISCILLYGYGNRPKPKVTMDLIAYREWEDVAAEYNRRNPDDQITTKQARDCFRHAQKKLIKELAKAGITERTLV